MFDEGTIDNNADIVQSLYNMPHYNMDLGITWSCCGSQFFFLWNFTQELYENNHFHGHFPFIPL